MVNYYLIMKILITILLFCGLIFVSCNRNNVIDDNRQEKLMLLTSSIVGTSLSVLLTDPNGLNGRMVNFTFIVAGDSTFLQTTGDDTTAQVSFVIPDEVGDSVVVLAGYTDEDGFTYSARDLPLPRASIVISPVPSEQENVRIGFVDERRDSIVIRNFGNASVDISEYIICNSKNHFILSDLSQENVFGDFLLSPGDTVGIRIPESIFSEVALYQDIRYTDTGVLVDFLQWDVPQNLSRQSVAVAKGIWTEDQLLPQGNLFTYQGDGTEEGDRFPFWEVDTFATVSQVEIFLNNFTIDSDTLDLFENDQIQLVAKVEAMGDASENVIWTSSSPVMASISGTGLLNAGSVGEATIIVTSIFDSSFTDTLVVNIVERVDFVANNTLLEVGQQRQFRATVTSSGGANDSVAWSSSDTLIATVDSTATVTGRNLGSVIITATSIFDPTKTAQVNLIISLPTVAFVNIQLDSDTISVMDSTRFVTEIIKVGSINETLLWTSIDTSIAQVSSTGNILGISPGQTNIIVRSFMSPQVMDTALIIVTN